MLGCLQKNLHCDWKELLDSVSIGGALNATLSKQFDCVGVLHTCEDNFSSGGWKTFAKEAVAELTSAGVSTISTFLCLAFDFAAKVRPGLGTTKFHRAVQHLPQSLSLTCSWWSLLGSVPPGSGPRLLTWSHKSAL